MAETHWTPGPWLYQQGLLWRDTGSLMPTDLLKIDGAGYDPEMIYGDAEAQANSRLIAASPTLYDALKLAEETIRVLCERVGPATKLVIQKRLVPIHLALAKARGEADV